MGQRAERSPAAESDCVADRKWGEKIHCKRRVTGGEEGRKTMLGNGPIRKRTMEEESQVRGRNEKTDNVTQ